MGRVDAETRARTRQALLETAAEHFARDGLDAANINRISIDAGLAKGTVYNYFDSKEALFLEVVEHACALAAHGFHEVPTDADTRTRLHALIASDIAWARADEAFARVLVREVFTGSPEHHERIVAAAAPYLQAVIDVLEDGMRRGEVRDDLPAPHLALVFAGLGDMMLVQYWGSGGAWPRLEDIPDLLTTLFVDGVASRPTSVQEDSK